jgi:hypothetical protein
MLKKAASFVLASLKASTYISKVRFSFSLAAAALNGLFEHPTRYSLIAVILCLFAVPVMYAQVVGDEAEMARLQNRAEEAIANGDSDGAALHSGKAALMAAQLAKQHQDSGVAEIYRGAEALFRAQEQAYRAQALFQRAGGQTPASSGVCGTLQMAELKVTEATRRLNVKLEPAIEAGYRPERDRLRGQAADWAQTIDGMGKDFECERR